MSTMNDVHQFRVRTPSFLISADVPVQVRQSQQHSHSDSSSDERLTTGSTLRRAVEERGGKDEDQRLGGGHRPEGLD